MKRIATITSIWSLALGALATIASACAGAATGPEYFPMPGPSLPFSESVLVGETLYVSGQIGVVPGTLNLVPGGIGPETHRVMDNIKAIVEKHGSSLDQLVKCTVFLADIKEWPAFNEIYRDYFKAHPPARSALAANGLAFNARVEVECIAFVPRKSAAH
ncbi:MAG: 2-iminobutanoate/2-iminopropanoate deaminase [Gammaproteobacteria bacterium]|nr:2-iminobutanoate/2-iminopropanoate deaminase [Gammaproteobacteria bacterium]